VAALQVAQLVVADAGVHQSHRVLTTSSRSRPSHCGRTAHRERSCMARHAAELQPRFRQYMER
jgi:hypothetical protein